MAKKAICHHCKKPITGSPAVVHEKGKPDVLYHSHHAKHHGPTPIDDLDTILAAYPKAYGHERHRLSDSLMRLVLAHPELVSKVPDAVLWRADHDSTLAPGFGDEPPGYRVKINRAHLEQGGRDPALADQWEAEDRARGRR